MSDKLTVRDIAAMVDHTVLAPFSKREEFVNACRFALQHKCASVCICPFFVDECAQRLDGSDVKTCTVIGFPHGTSATEAKVAETLIALATGADEIDMVVNIAKVKDRDWKFVKDDISAVTTNVHAAGKKIKVIFENCYLDEEEKIMLCKICTELRCDWVKTSTGFGTGGSTIEDLNLMKANIGPDVQIKAAGGIRTLDQLLEARNAGATRIGCSRTKDILEDAAKRFS
ncbi:MAG: deoxyribose-phosphate aldolase [Lentisphaerae bacterium]|jgi:deoxyribose-phosphate aldolase|nr:deoxyribose-phosphate aldolase [Lentisphaerota bacterium]